MADNSRMRFRFWLGIAAAVAVAAGSVVAGAIVRSNDRETFERREAEAAGRAALQAETLSFLAIGQLKAATALYQLEEEIGRHEFEVLADRLLREGALRATAFASAGGECCPVVHISSLFDGPAGRGFDLGTAPDHAVAIRRARDSGRPAITPLGPTLLGPGRGFVVYAPVFHDGAPTGSVAQRRASVRGFAAGAFRATDMTTAAAVSLPDDFAVQLLEDGEPVVGPEEIIGDGASAPIRVADRTWLLVVRDPSGPGVGAPLLIAVLGISLAALLGALVVIWSHNERMRELQRQASHDSLTGLKNRRRFAEDVRTELARSRRQGKGGALLLLDLDNFKQVNDTLGHPMGDRVIEEIAGVLRRRMRVTDVLGRLGGDEFGVVLPGCNEEEAASIAEAIATAIREHVPPQDDLPPITASVGIAMFGPDPRADVDSLQAEADAAMYAAKRDGRNAVRLADEPLPTAGRPPDGAGSA